jgi:signal transduction histidine kinase
MIARARVQAGNLAHSLRTPLAIITDEAERLGKHAEGRASGAALLDQARAMEQQIEYQLARARSAVGQKYAGKGVVIADVALPILRAMRRLHPDKQFTLEASGCEEVVLPLDGVDYAEVLAILLDNAGKWANRDVTLSFARDEAGSFTARIEDDGPGIPEELIESAFAVGTRFDSSVTGSGLGLAIARDLSAAMGITLTLNKGAVGLVAELRYSPDKLQPE